MNENEVLREMGLSEGEAKVYLTLLETGSSLAGPIIKRTGLHRGTTYQIIQRLKEKGLVSSIVKGKKQYFEAVNPERLLDILRDKEEQVREILPNLKAKLSEGNEKQEITVYSGVNGVRSVLDKILNDLGKSGEYYDFGVSGLLKEVMKDYWYIWQKRKKKQKIKSYVIFNENVKEKRDLLKEYYGEARFHPREYSSLTDTIIYNDNVVLLIWTAKPVVAVVIKNKDNANSYRNQFKLMWRFAKK
jgi:sugar-specific transcriptional regulator TrmB